MMKMEIRNNCIIVQGYVNAVERYSRELSESGKVFIEKIKAGAFKDALEKNKNVKMLYNHSFNRILATQKDNTLELEEDNIGLRAKAVIRDLDVIEEAKKGRLTGWSFGFNCLDEIWDKEKRTVNSLYLHEVSLLSVEPAYLGTSVEIRNSEEKAKVEIRCGDELQIEVPKVNVEDTTEYRELNKFLQEADLNIFINSCKM